MMQSIGQKNAESLQAAQSHIATIVQQAAQPSTALLNMIQSIEQSQAGLRQAAITAIVQQAAQPSTALLDMIQGIERKNAESLQAVQSHIAALVQQAAQPSTALLNMIQSIEQSQAGLRQTLQGPTGGSKKPPRTERAMQDAETATPDTKEPDQATEEGQSSGDSKDDPVDPQSETGPDPSTNPEG